MKIKYKVYLTSILAVLLTFTTINSNARDVKTVIKANGSGELTCPKGFVKIPSGLACMAANLTSAATVYAPPAQNCPRGFQRIPEVNFCIAKNLTLEVKKGVMLIADLDQPGCPEGFSLAPNSMNCTADNFAFDTIDSDSDWTIMEHGYILGDTTSQQELSVGMLPGTPGAILVNNGPSNGVSDWNLLDQPGFSDYDCDSFFPTEWGYAFANNDVDVAQATFIDTDESIEGKTFYAGSHGHTTTYIGACVAGGLYPNWDCNRVDLRIEKKSSSGTWNEVNTFHLVGDPQDSNGGERFTFVSTIPGHYRAVLDNAAGCSVLQRVGVGVAYKDLPLKIKKY